MVDLLIELFVLESPRRQHQQLRHAAVRLEELPHEVPANERHVLAAVLLPLVRVLQRLLRPFRLRENDGACNFLREHALALEHRRQLRVDAQVRLPATAAVLVVKQVARAVGQ